MRILPLPKSWLIHSIIYKGHTGRKDDFQRPVFAEPVEIEHVRFDESTVFSRDATQTKIVAEAVIFVDAVNSSPVPNFKGESVITFGEKDFTLKKIVPCYYPTRNEVHHWELEVI